MKYDKDIEIIMMMVLHCIICQENLCKKCLLNFDHAMSVVAKTEAFIRSKERSKDSFRSSVTMETEHGDMVIT